MKKKSTIWLMMAPIGIVAGISIGFIAGASRIIRVNAKSNVLIQSIILRTLEAGNTTNAVRFLETSIINSLNSMQWAEQYPVCHVFQMWNWEEPSGAHWDYERQWAMERTQQERDQLNYFIQHPDELKKQFEELLGVRVVEAHR